MSGEGFNLLAATYSLEGGRSTTPREIPCDEKTLARGLMKGDPQAWAALCDAYAGPLYVYAYHRTGGDRHMAEDVRQETLIAAAERIGSYRGEVPLFSWLCGIARHKAADQVRQARRIGTPLDLPDMECASGQAHESAGLVEALWALPEAYREALLARYQRGDSVGGVAARIGRSYKATESLLSRAREALRNNLAEVDSDERHQ